MIEFFRIVPRIVFIVDSDKGKYIFFLCFNNSLNTFKLTMNVNLKTFVSNIGSNFNLTNWFLLHHSSDPNGSADLTFLDLNINENNDRKISFHWHQKSTDIGKNLNFRICAPLNKKKCDSRDGTYHFHCSHRLAVF